ncbi:MAG: chromate efflux transporter [Deltaproteobacteria bacterium]|nr:chromate efflux transporter [Deltaproteobacteria bacterium]
MHYKEIALYFLKLGFLGFGGPLALLASYQKDLVEKRKWLSPERFAQGLALIKALPGATATQTAIYLGNVRGGVPGGLIAGTCLIAPSFVMMLCLGVFYTSVQSLAWSKALFFGMQSAALGVIVESVWRLSKPYRLEFMFWVMAVLACLLATLRPSIEPLVIIGSGLFGILIMKLTLRSTGQAMLALLPMGLLGGAGVELGVLKSLTAVFLKAGVFIFGTGLAIVPLLAHDVVETHHWLTQAQFMDALAFGQITPGPVLITSTFIGYKVAGIVGAVVATAGVFFPAFFNILTWFPIAERKFSKSPYARQFVMFAVGAVVGSIAVAVVRLGMAPTSGGTHALAATIAVAALLISLFTKFPVWLVIPCGGLLAAAVNLAVGAG